MIWIILGIVFLVMTIWSLRGITIAEYHYKNRVDEYHVPVWILLIAFVIYCIPIMGILAFISYHIWFFALVSRKPHNDYEYWIIELSSKNTLHRILGAVVSVLNKTI